MTMKLAPTSAILAAALAAGLYLAPASFAQSQAAPASKPAAKKAHTKSKKAAAPAAAAAAQPEGAGGAKVETIAAKRDPFVPLINLKKEDPMAGHYPPGKAGLVIATVRVDGAVRSAGGMIAVVTNPEQKVYFIREGDHLYDGLVEKIGLDGVTFRENSKDAFGKPVERSVTKRIYGSAGDQQ
jgi:hypothetical protein